MVLFKDIFVTNLLVAERWFETLLQQCLHFKKRDNKVVALGNPSKPSGCSNHVLKQKLKREHHLTGALRNQSNKHQNFDIMVFPFQFLF